MSVIKGFAIEALKLKRSSFWMFWLGSTLLGMFFLGFYFRMYNSQTEEKRISLIFEMIATLLPLICSIATAYLIRQEEQIANLYGMLAVCRRGKNICIKLLFTWLLGSASIFGLFLGIAILGSGDGKITLRLIELFGGMAFFSLFFYIFHFFMNLKFGIGISLFWGVFESMQAVMYSNIRLRGAFRLIPFAWLMEWKQDIQDELFLQNISFWSGCVFLLLVSLLLFVRWFTGWEGRKNYGTS